MPSLNKVILIGNLGKNPEMRLTPSGKSVTTFSLATSSHWTDSNGEKKEATDWFAIITWGKLAEICNRYLSKGSLAYIEGRVGLHTWEDKEGKSHSRQEVVANKVLFLQTKNNENEVSKSNNPEDCPLADKYQL